MEVKLIWTTPDAEKVIAHCARVSSDWQDNPEHERLLRYCMKHGHWSIFEMAHMCVEITTSRAISAQLLRHRSFSFQEFSQRYQQATTFESCDARRQDAKNRQNSVDDLPDTTQRFWAQAMANVQQTAEMFYDLALKEGVAKECARMLLPLCTTTKLYMVGSARSWIHYLQVRTDPSTQQEHREIATAIEKIFCEQFPTVGKFLEGE